jgi:hypothetical protein
MTNTPPVSPEQWRLAFEAEQSLHNDLLLAQIAARTNGIKNLTEAVILLNDHGFAVLTRCSSESRPAVFFLHQSGASLDVEGSSPTAIISGILAITTAQPADSEEAA